MVLQTHPSALKERETARACESLSREFSVPKRSGSMSTYYPENASPQQPGSYYDDRSADGSGYPVDDERNYNPNDNDEPPFDDNHPASNDVYSTNQHTIDDDDYPGRMETNQDLDIHDERRAYPDEGSHYHDDPTRPPSIHDPYGDDQYSRSYADDSYYSGRTGSTSSSRRYRRKEMGEEKEGCCHNCCPCPYGPLIVVPMFFVCAAVMCTYYSAFECTFFQVSGLFKRDITLTYGLWTTEQYDQFKIGRTEVQAAGLHIGTANTCVMWNNHPSLTMDDLDGPLKIGRNLVILACALAVINMIWIFVATRRMYSNCMVGVFIILMIVTAIFQACTFVSLNSSYCQNLSEGEVCSLDFAGYISIVACIFWLFAACATALLRRYVSPLYCGCRCCVRLHECC